MCRIAALSIRTSVSQVLFRGPRLRGPLTIPVVMVISVEVAIAMAMVTAIVIRVRRASNRSGNGKSNLDSNSKGPLFNILGPAGGVGAGIDSVFLVVISIPLLPYLYYFHYPPNQSIVFLLPPDE